MTTNELLNRIGYGLYFVVVRRVLGERAKFRISKHWINQITYILYHKKVNLTSIIVT